MARRKRHEEHINHEAWAIPYGDLITLLLAFFVVMYATSSLNEGKYRVLSYSIAAAFHNAPRTVAPVQVGAPVVGSATYDDTLQPLPLDTLHNRMQQGSMLPVPFPEPGKFVPEENAKPDPMQPIEDELHEAFKALEASGDVRIRRGKDGIEIAIGSDLLFASGSATLSDSSEEVLRSLAKLLAANPNGIVVEGHTDNVPIRNLRFPSNWELSAGRAGRVLRLFSDAGVDGGRMSMRAYGEQRPEVPNDTVQGRAQNRRVVVIVQNPVDVPRPPAAST